MEECKKAFVTHLIISKQQAHDRKYKIRGGNTLNSSSTAGTREMPEHVCLEISQ